MRVSYPTALCGLDVGRSASDFPALKHCWAMDNTTTQDYAVDEVTGTVSLDRSAAGRKFVPNGDGSQIMQGVSPTDLVGGTPHPLTFENKTVLLLGFFRDFDTLGELFVYGDAYANGPGIGTEFDNSSAYAVVSVTPVANYVGSNASIPSPFALQNGSEPLAYSVCYQHSGSNRLEALVVGETVARNSNPASIDIVGSMAGGPYAPYDTGGAGPQVILPCRNSSCYGVLLFEFDSATLPDWKEGVEWMYHDWKAKADGSPGEKRIYPPWKGRT